MSELDSGNRELRIDPHDPAALRQHFYDDTNRLEGNAPKDEQSVFELTGRSKDPHYAGISGQGFSVGADTGPIGSCEIVTDYHIVGAMSGPPQVRMHNGDKLPARIVGINPKEDVAVLKIDGVRNPGSSCPPLALGSSEGFNPSQTVGVRVANDSKSMGLFIGYRQQRSLQSDDPNVDPNRKVLEFISAAGHGNSGDPIVGIDNKVIGMTWGIDPRGVITDATRVEAIKSTLDQVHRSGG